MFTDAVSSSIYSSVPIIAKTISTEIKSVTKYKKNCDSHEFMRIKTFRIWPYMWIYCCLLVFVLILTL